MLITCLAAAVVAKMSKVALSRGWSLLGNHKVATSGSPAASAPSLVVHQAPIPWEESLAGKPA